MIPKRFKAGESYRIRFYDHSIGMSDKTICETQGWVIEDDGVHVLLTYWRVCNKDEEIERSNLEPISIIKSCIIRARKLP